MNVLVYLGLLLPLSGFLLLVAGSSFINRKIAGVIGCTSIILSFICFFSLFLMFEMGHEYSLHLTLFPWIPVEGMNTQFSLHLDPLSVWMGLIITGVGSLIHLYSIGYMDHDEDIVRFFAFMNFFVFSMLLLVLAGDLLVMFVGWEGVGLASYLLIGFWYTLPEAPPAATKAFVMNRIGDLGFLLGVLLTLYTFGSSDIEEISSRASSVEIPTLTVITLLLFIGAIGKSAQLPLYTWLPDAMAGPTPVSALIHAATMVTAGVYLIVRLHALYILTPITLNVIGIIGGATALFAAVCAVGQTDLKRVLAFSTVSQLGLMFLACGVGAFYAAMFHLTTHAFIKALLFLSAGNVVHMMHGNTQMEKMGGLAKVFPYTHWLFLIGVLALSGVPPLAAFFSKDLILEVESHAGYHTLFYIGLAASILTAFYLTRAYCLTFAGSFRVDYKVLATLKEAPWIMVIPVSVLAFLAIIGGFFGFSFSDEAMLEEFLSEIGLSVDEQALTTPEALLSFPTLLAFLGGIGAIAAAVFIYVKYGIRFLQISPLLKHAFFVDEIYHALFVTPLKALARVINSLCEPFLFEGSVQAVVKATQGGSRLLQRMQGGIIRSYAAWMVAGAVFIVAYFVF